MIYFALTYYLLGVNLLLSAICGITMLWAGSTLELLVLPGLYVIFAGTTVSVVNSVVIEAIPTQLRYVVKFT